MTVQERTAEHYEASRQLKQELASSLPSETNSIPSSLSASALFDQAIDLLRVNFVSIFLTVALILFPLQLIEQYITAMWLDPAGALINTQGDSADPLQMLLVAIGFVLTGVPRNAIPGVMLLGAVLFASAPVAACVSHQICGKPVSVINGYRQSFARIPQLVFAALLSGLCCLTIWFFTTFFLVVGGLLCLGVISIVIAGFGDAQPAVWLTVIYMLICIVVPYAITCVFFGRTFALVVPVIVVERASVMTAVSRSRQLSSSVPYSTTLLTFGMLPITVFAVQHMLMFGCDSMLQLLDLSPLWQYACSTAVCAITICLLHSYWMVFLSRLYFDYRIRRECLDIRMLLGMENGG